MSPGVYEREVLKDLKLVYLQALYVQIEEFLHTSFLSTQIDESLKVVMQ